MITAKPALVASLIPYPIILLSVASLAKHPCGTLPRKMPRMGVGLPFVAYPINTGHASDEDRLVPTGHDKRSERDAREDGVYCGSLILRKNVWNGVSP